MTPGLLALKRLYWNCRTFRTGRRRQQTPYGLLGVQLPTTDWWELLRLPPEQLYLLIFSENSRSWLAFRFLHWQA
jgi:hypothetical protein